MVGVRALVPGGARLEAVPGQALITGRALTEGTGRVGWRELADETEAYGASVASSGSFDAHGAVVDARLAHWRRAVEWAVELALDPAFPEERCRWAALQASAELDSLRDQPEVRTAFAFLDHLYHPHPRSRPLHGDRESLARLSGAECAAFHRARLAAAGLVLTVAGPVDEEEVEGHVREVLAGYGEEGLGLTGGGSGTGPEDGAAAGVPEPVGRPERRREVTLPPGDQAHLYAGCRTIPRAHPDRHALSVLGVVLGAGAGLAGRLPERVREREGLAYSVQVSTLAGAGVDAGRLAVYVGTSPATVERAEAAVAEELERVVEEGVGGDEVEAARGYLLGREPFRRETARQWADLLGEAAVYGVPEDDPEWRRRGLEAVDVEAVGEAARRHLHLDGLKVTVGLPG